MGSLTSPEFSATPRDCWCQGSQLQFLSPQVGFRHCKDYVAYVWAKHEDMDGNIYQVLRRGGEWEEVFIALGVQGSVWGVLWLPP